MRDWRGKRRLINVRSLQRLQGPSRTQQGLEPKVTGSRVQVKLGPGATEAQTRNPPRLAGPHSYYQPYYKDVHEVKDVIRYFADYQRERSRSEMLAKRHSARRRTIYDVMAKDSEKTLTRARIYHGPELCKEGRKVETLVRPEAYDQSKRNLSTLSHILSRLREFHHRSLGLPSH